LYIFQLPAISTAAASYGHASRTRRLGTCLGAWHQVGLRTRPAVSAKQLEVQGVWRFGRVLVPGTETRPARSFTPLE